MIRLLDPTRIDAAEANALRDAFERVLASGTFILGPEVAALESELATTLGSKHTVGVSSGTDALLTALLAIGVGPGSEVIVPSYSFFATAGSVARTGATPVFVDIDLRDFMPSASMIASRIGPNTKAIVIAHLFGQAAEMGPLRSTAKMVKVPIVEDAAQSFGARLDGRAVGTFGVAGAFSFFPTKNLAALGDGGLVATDDDTIADRVRLLRTHGSRTRDRHEVVGGNFRLDALQAAFLRARLPLVQERTERRAAIAKAYVDRLRSCGIGAPNDGQPIEREDLVLLPRVIRGEHVWNQFVVRVPARKRDALRAHLTAHGIETAVYYSEILPKQPCFASLPTATDSFPNATTAAAESLALPIDPGLRTNEIDQVVNAIAAFLRR